MADWFGNTISINDHERDLIVFTWPGVWQDGQIICSIFGHLRQRKFAQLQTKSSLKKFPDLKLCSQHARIELNLSGKFKYMWNWSTPPRHQSLNFEQSWLNFCQIKMFYVQLLVSILFHLLLIQWNTSFYNNFGSHDCEKQH